MSLLEFNNFAGALEFSFKDPDSEHLYQASSMRELCDRIKSYRSQNELPAIEFLETVVENYLCRLPIHVGACRKKPPLKRGFMQYLKGGIALIQNLRYNSLVSQEVADARSAICKDCPANVFLDKGKFVQWTDTIALHSTEGKRSKYHDSLGNCEICSCTLKAKTWFNGKIDLPEDQKQKMREVSQNKCWQVNG